MTRERDVRGVLKTHFHCEGARASECLSRCVYAFAPVSDVEEDGAECLRVRACARVGWGARTRVRALVLYVGILGWGAKELVVPARARLYAYLGFKINPAPHVWFTKR